MSMTGLSLLWCWQPKLLKGGTTSLQQSLDVEQRMHFLSIRRFGVATSNTGLVQEVHVGLEVAPENLRIHRLMRMQK